MVQSAHCHTYVNFLFLDKLVDSGIQLWSLGMTLCQG